MSDKEIISFDYDDILFYFTLKYQKHCILNHNLIPVPTHLIKSPDFKDVFYSDKDVAQEIYDNMLSNKEEWEKFHVLDETEEEHMKHIYSHLLQLKNKYRLVIVTARSSLENFHIVVNYCNRYFPNIFDDYHFCNSYSRVHNEVKRTKSEICLQYNIRVLIDDNLHNIRDVQCNNIIGIPFGSHPWSQHEDNVPTWEKLVDVLLELKIK